MSVGPVSLFFFIFISGILQNTINFYKYLYKKINKILLGIPKINLSATVKIKDRNTLTLPEITKIPLVARVSHARPLLEG